MSQSKNEGYDTYDSCVVAAETEVDARYIHPIDYKNDKNDLWYENDCGWYSDWAHPHDITVELIGVAIEDTEQGVICASFNAG